MDKYELEAQITTIEKDILPDLRGSLKNLVEGEEFFESDRDYFENEIAKAEGDLKKLKRLRVGK